MASEEETKGGAGVVGLESELEWETDWEEEEEEEEEEGGRETKGGGDAPDAPDVQDGVSAAVGSALLLREDLDPFRVGDEEEKGEGEGGGVRDDAPLVVVTEPWVGEEEEEEGEEGAKAGELPP